MDRAKVTVVDHPLVQHKLTLMRRAETSTANFRRLLSELSALLAYEVLRQQGFPGLEQSGELHRHAWSEARG